MKIEDKIERKKDAPAPAPAYDLYLLSVCS